MKTLAQNYTVYAIDLLGFGASDKPLGFSYTMETWAQVFKCWSFRWTYLCSITTLPCTVVTGINCQQLILDFLEEVIQKPTVLIGNSVGSLACLIAASGMFDSSPSGSVRSNHNFYQTVKHVEFASETSFFALIIVSNQIQVKLLLEELCCWIALAVWTTKQLLMTGGSSYYYPCFCWLIFYWTKRELPQPFLNVLNKGILLILPRLGHNFTLKIFKEATWSCIA